MKQMSLSKILCLPAMEPPFQQSPRGARGGDSKSFCQSDGILIVLGQLYMLIPTTYPEGRTLNPDARANSKSIFLWCEYTYPPNSKAPTKSNFIRISPIPPNHLANKLHYGVSDHVQNSA
ncbi:hypothetical protein CEXT_569741 [Caerostris extrusa]|uniref:Uncharacterized protein n=1 Tax=Caerostris extrusa TaxID=172846 RepID=A0AAV4XBI2_CAEEX|nr:hypothetical protein CEXT_569741 [Caerostris extrusa]